MGLLKDYWECESRLLGIGISVAICRYVDM